ncbi:MAG: alginate O-acetyltransferase complex protein AlgJ [Parasphingorhabdus sp.]
MSPKNFSIALNSIVVAVFLVFLFLPSISFLNGIGPQLAEEENRRAATLPAWQFKKAAIKKYPEAFGNWFSDHMGIRQHLVQAHGLINRDWLKSHDSVLTGTNDWLFLLREPTRVAVAPPIPSDYCGRNPFGQVELQRWKSSLLDNWKQQKQEGRQYVLMIVPNKQTIYSSHLPSRVLCKGGDSRLDQLIQSFANEPDFPLLDLRPVFLAQAQPPLWYRTDTHWNGRGASLALDNLLDYLNSQLELKLTNVISTSRFSMRVRKTKGWGLAVMSGMKHSFVESEPQIVPRKPRASPLENPFPNRTRDLRRQPQAYHQEDPQLPNILVLHDSFFDKRIKRLLTGSFARSSFVWHRGKPSLAIENELINQVAPDIVLHEMVERNLLHDYFK